MDWKDVLQGLRQDPSLPEGEEPKTDVPATKTEKKDTLHVVLEKKGRNGKVATIVEGFTVDDGELQRLAASLKKKLGVGGSARGGEILIQGNLVDKVKQFLINEGFKVKGVR